MAHTRSTSTRTISGKRQQLSGICSATVSQIRPEQINQSANLLCRTNVAAIQGLVPLLAAIFGMDMDAGSHNGGKAFHNVTIG